MGVVAAAVPPRRRGAHNTKAADVVQAQVRVDRDRRRPAMLIAAAVAIAVEVIAAAWTGMGSVRIGSIGRHTELMMGRWW